MVAVGLAGSRALAEEFRPLVRRVVAGMVRSGVSCFSVGDARGADAFARAALAAAGSSVRVRVFAPWQGLRTVARLRWRTRQMVASVAAGGVVVVFLGHPGSRGSVLTCLLALRRGLRVVAFPCGFPAASLPSLGVGSWVAVGSGVCAGAFVWHAQNSKTCKGVGTC